MKIYFAGSIRGGRDDKALYAELIAMLSNFGQVLTEHIGDQTLSALGDDGPNDTFIYNRDMQFLHEADVIIAEVTQPSLGVGYEIGWAESNHKPVLCLFREQPNKRISAMIAGNDKLSVLPFVNVDNAQDIVINFLQEHNLA